MNGRDQKRLKSIFIYTILIFIVLSPYSLNWIPGVTFNVRFIKIILTVL